MVMAQCFLFLPINFLKLKLKLFVFNVLSYNGCSNYAGNYKLFLFLEQKSLPGLFHLEKK